MRSWPSAAGPMSPEPMTRGSSSGTSEMNSARAGRPRSLPASRPPLMRDSAARRRFNSPMASPSAKARRVSASRSGSVTPASGTSTRLEAPPEMRNSGSTSPGRLSTHASSRPPAASERSSGTGWAPMRTSADDFELAAPLAARVLRRIRALQLQPPEIFGRDVSGHVFAREAGGVELLDARILVLAGCDQVGEVLVHQPVRADEARHLLHRAAARDQLARRRHVDSVDVREAHGRGGGGEVHLLRAGFAGELDDLRRSRAADDRVVDQQHRLAAELEIDGVELAPHRLLALVLPRHDEGAADVAVLDEALAVLDGEALRELQRAGAAGVRDRDDHVDVVPGALAQDLVRQAIAHAHAGAVDGDVVDLRVGAREVHVLEDAGGVARRRDALLRVEPALLVDEHRLPRRHVAHQAEREGIERHALGSEHPFGAARGAALAEHQRADAVRVAKAEDAVADDHRHHGVAAAAAAVYRGERGEHVRGRHASGADPLQLGSEDVQQHLGIRGGVEVTAVLADQDLRELGGVGEVAVVPEADAVGRVDVERLRLGGAVAAGGRIAHVADADVALELEHVMLLEDVAHESAALAHVELALAAGGDAGGVLAAMLQHRESVIETLVDGAHSDDADDAAHV